MKKLFGLGAWCLVLGIVVLGCNNDVEPFVRNVDWSTLSARLNADSSTPDDFITPRPNFIGTIAAHQYFSTTTGAYRTVNIFTPPNFDPNRNYPVLYLLHGIGGTHNEWNGAQPNALISNLIANGMTVPMIVVMPNTRARYDDTSDLGNNPANVAAFNNFINDLRDDLMPFIEDNFPVTHERSQTAIAGLSMGGRTALYIGVRMPNAFMYIGSFSTAPGIGPGPGGLLQADEFTIPAALRNETFIFLNHGNGEEQPFGAVTRGVLNAFVANGTPNVVHYVTTGGHDFNVWRNGLYHFASNIFHR